MTEHLDSMPDAEGAKQVDRHDRMQVQLQVMLFGVVSAMLLLVAKQHPFCNSLVVRV